jgi:hypothetical protein
MIKKLFRILAVALIVGVSLVPLIGTTPVFAVTAQPLITPTITQIHINRNLYQDNDTLVYGMYYLKYKTIPDVNADENFKFYLMDSGGTTYFGIASFFVYHDGGYNHGLISFYFPEGVLTWGTSYKIRIEEIAGQFSSPVNTDITIPTSAYSTETTQAGNQAELADKLFAIGQTLETEYDTIFFQDSDTGQILTDVGEVYFRGAVPGIRVMAPSLFLFQESPVDLTTRTYDTANFDTYQARFQGTWVGTAINAGASGIGMGGGAFMMFIFTLPLCLIAVIFASIKFRKADAGFIVASLMMICAVLLGFMPTALFATVYQIFAIYIGYIFFYSKSSSVLDNKLLAFSAFCWISSTLICIVLEGSYMGADENSIINGLSVVRIYTLPIIGDIPVLNTDFIGSLARILTWDYSFYTGSWAFLRIFWVILLTPGPIWGLIQFFINLMPSIISIFRPSVT